jgi:ribonuclease P protein component
MPDVPKAASVSAPEIFAVQDDFLPIGTFSRQQRLLTASDFKQVFDRPVKTGTPAFSLLARPNGRGHARLGLAVPKKQVRRAVDRNRIKRVIRESFRQAQDDLAGLDIVVLVRSKARELDNRQLRKELERQWQRLKKKCENSLSF